MTADIAPGIRITPAQAEAALANITSVPRSAPLMEHGTLLVKMYGPRGVDAQTPHTRDEVYVVARGRGRFMCAGRTEPFETGDLLFVPAGVEHRFVEFSEDFMTWVLFYGPEGGERVAGATLA